MFGYLGVEYVPIEEDDFFAASAVAVAPRLIGCVLHHENCGKDTAIMIAEAEAYDEGDGATHGSELQRLPHGHVYVHRYRNMWCIDLVCGAEGRESSVLIRAGVPVVGIGIMAERRSEAADAERAIRERANGYEKKLCKGPCNVGEALGLYTMLDGASLFKPPFRVLRPVSPPRRLLNSPRINVSRDAYRLWRGGHPDYRAWLSKPFPREKVA